MILVKSVEIEHVYGREAQLAICQPINSPWHNDDPSGLHHTVEVVQAQVFINSRGEKVIVGLSKEVQLMLGLPMEAFQDMSKRISQLQYEVTKYQDKYLKVARWYGDKVCECNVADARIRDIKKANFWKRIKFLFTGVRI